MKELDIGLVAKLSGVAPSTLRFYEKKGLITPIGRNGLRRQYRQDVLHTLQLIALGQAAGFTLEEMRGMFDAQGKVTIEREKMLERARAIDKAILRLQLLSRGLKHVANCTQPDHSQCHEFQKTVARGLSLTK
ncbi:Copper export regulator [Serratia rubidaea]|uniref:Copper export regulator n=1 Tax=Serratia rubidaea TaxID=61652 RepID=A0A4U9HGB6_SERRU|nr:MerR family transcriptional regulator [Serratia rubidaea]MBS0975362.1 MerR family transcriptional regulator [Serratia rubidaea]MDC6111745.1 MerR family transcriptional regulator [Serratia rubidaea]QPR61897.1 MerR family transcriptional regulator [Serratia rubidaea]UJD79396.1 MerR family transcriptional regulator [Serratia rubidaea]UJD83951.1 MerR family transcriptional regulator [Serratia rubidaea]